MSIYGELHSLSRQVSALSQQLSRMESIMSKALDDLTAAVAAEKTVTNSIVALVTDIAERLKQALADDDTEAIEALATELGENTAKLAAAVTQNTPTPAPAPEPPAPTPDPNAPQG